MIHASRVYDDQAQGKAAATADPEPVLQAFHKPGSNLVWETETFGLLKRNVKHCNSGTATLVQFLSKPSITFAEVSAVVTTAIVAELAAMFNISTAIVDVSRSAVALRCRLARRGGVGHLAHQHGECQCVDFWKSCRSAW